MDLQAYLDRIGFEGTPRRDLATLRALHSRHLLAIPYENLDVQLGRPLTRDPADALPSSSAAAAAAGATR